jgi:hypothetical protein
MMFQNSKRRLGRGLDLISHEAQKEKATVMVGGDVSHFDDDIETKCDLCDSVIYLRPHSVKMSIRMAKRVCVQCAIIEIGLKEQRGEKVEAIVTKESLEDFRNYEKENRRI